MGKRYDIELLLAGFGIMAIPEPFSYWIGGGLILYALISMALKAKENPPKFDITAMDAFNYVRNQTLAGTDSFSDKDCFSTMAAVFERGGFVAGLNTPWGIEPIARHLGGGNKLQATFEGEKLTDIFVESPNIPEIPAFFDSGQIESIFPRKR